MQTDRRSRSREARRASFLAAARALVDEGGVEAITIKAVADRVDCAVGTLYSSFASKSALVAALQADAIGRLGTADAHAAEVLDAHDLAGLDVDTAALARLVSFGRATIAAERVLPDDYRLQQRLLGSRGDYEAVDLAVVVPAAFAVLARPEQLLREAVALGLLDAGDAFDRTITWVAAINGVLALATIQLPGEGFKAAELADRLQLDLLVGWGANPANLIVAAAHVPLERMAILMMEAGR